MNRNVVVGLNGIVLHTILTSFPAPLFPFPTSPCDQHNIQLYFLIAALFFPYVLYTVQNLARPARFHYFLPVIKLYEHAPLGEPYVAQAVNHQATNEVDDG